MEENIPTEQIKVDPSVVTTPSKAPNSIMLKHKVLACDLSGTQDCFVGGCIDGTVQVYHYGIEQNKLLLDIRPHRRSCYSVIFNRNGDHLISGSSDKSIVLTDLNTSKDSWRKNLAHDDSIHSVFEHDGKLISGDENGIIKIWDPRQNKMVKGWNRVTDYISDFDIENNTLVATSGDGILSIYDLKTYKSIEISDSVDDELLCVSTDGNEVVCGSQSGSFFTYKWDEWVMASSISHNHRDSINSMVSFNDYIITASSDGFIRLCRARQKNIVGIIGEDKKQDSIEKIEISRDFNLLVSISMDKTAKFWDLSWILSDEGTVNQEAVLNSNITSKKKKIQNFFQDI